MATPKGVRIGGRQAGTPNKSTVELQERARALGVDPFEILCLFAKGDYEALGYEKERVKAISEFGTVYELTISPELRQKSAKDACEYIHSKRKAIEHSIDPEKGATLEEFIQGLSGKEQK